MLFRSDCRLLGWRHIAAPGARKQIPIQLLSSLDQARQTRWGIAEPRRSRLPLADVDVAGRPHRCAGRDAFRLKLNVMLTILEMLFVSLSRETLVSAARER